MGGGGDFCCFLFLPYYHLSSYHIFTYILVLYFIPVKLGPKYFLNVCLDLGLQEAQSVEYGVKQCQEMSVVLRRLIVDGKCFNYRFVDRISTESPFLYFKGSHVDVSKL